MKGNDAQKAKMYAHDRTYLIGNVAVICIFTAIFTYCVWQYLPYNAVLKVLLSGIGYLCSAYIEHQYLTGVVARFVEHFFPNEEATRRYRLYHEKKKH
jgi:hypothetical protein